MQCVYSKGKEGGGVRSCSVWEEANDLPWGRKGLPSGHGVGANYRD